LNALTVLTALTALTAPNGLTDLTDVAALTGLTGVKVLNALTVLKALYVKKFSLIPSASKGLTLIRKESVHGTPMYISPKFGVNKIRYASCKRGT
jgi:hypothetical protein